MQYQLLTLDIDGTLRPSSMPCVPRENVAAVRAVQRAGVRVAIATGRCRAGVSKQLINGIHPDYWICAAGAQVLDRDGNPLHISTMTDQQMYALVDFFENYDCFLGFNFEDGPYGYVNYAQEHERELARGVVNYIKDGEDQLGTRTKVKVVKNKVAPPFKRAEFDIMFGEGISKIGEIIDLGVDYGIIKKAGSWFSYGDRKIGQGRDAVKELLKKDEALSAEIEAKVREAMKEKKE